MEDDETKGDWIFQKVVEHMDALTKIAGAEVVDQVITDSAGDCKKARRLLKDLALREQQSSLACTTTCGSGRRGRIRPLSRCVYHRWC
jgi:hypothetical protein